ncbi:unnamed protein product [Diamesa serratosioi]
MNNIISSVVFISCFMINNAFSNIHSDEHREFSPRLLPEKLLKDMSNKLDFKHDDDYLISTKNVLPTDNNDSNGLDSSGEHLDVLQSKDFDEIRTKYEMMLKMLEDPRENKVPLIYIEHTNEPNLESAFGGTEKRSARYYQNYPSSWKRQHTTRYRTSRVQNHYNPELKNLCVPSREDIMNLLTGLHESRTGNERTVKFCNRKRPAKAIFTNIRFLG